MLLMDLTDPHIPSASQDPCSVLARYATGFTGKAITRINYRLTWTGGDRAVCQSIGKKEGMVGQVLEKALWSRERILSRRLKT